MTTDPVPQDASEDGKSTVSKGSPMATMADPDAVTHRRVLRIAIPILLSNVTVPILGAVDTGVVGQIPAAEPIAAVGIGSIVLSAIYWIFGFLRMG